MSSVLPEQFIIKRAPQTDDELWWTVRGLWGVQIPRTQVCADHVAPFTAFADAYFARHPVSVWKASRGYGGKSYLLAVLSATEMVMLGAEINLLGGSGAQSINIHSHTQEMWSWVHAPKALLTKDPTRLDTYTVNGGHIRSLTASQTSVRGPHPQRLRLDEIDEMEMEILEAAQGQPMRKKRGGKVIETQTVMCVVGSTLVMTRRGEVPITDVSRSDHVMTRQGWRRVRAVILSGHKGTVQLKLSNGRVLTCTDDHRIATPGGWVIPREMSVGQEVCGARTDLVVCQSGPAVVALPLIEASLQPLTRLALTPAPLRDDEVVTGVGMTGGAMSLLGVDSGRCGSPKDVDLVGHRFEVVGVDADAVAAEGITMEVTRVANQADVGPAVDGASMHGSVHRPVSPGDSPLPEPTRGVQRSRCDDRPAEEPVFVVDILAGGSHDVYDLSVHGVHEFVAEGIVIHNSSTHQYPDRTMSAILARAELQGWPAYHWCYRESSNPVDGWLKQDEVERKKSEIPGHMWDTEYELQEPNFDNRALDPETVARCFDAQLGETHSDHIRIMTEEQIPGGAHFVTGVDWAKKKDSTIVATFLVNSLSDRDVYRCVEWTKMGRMPWPLMVKRALDQWRRFPGKFIHDATGVGDVVDDIILNMVTESYLQKLIIPHIMTGGNKRAAFFSEYVAALERQDVQYPRIHYAYDEHRYMTDDDLYGKGHPPDSVVAGALAWSIRTRRNRARALVAPLQNTQANVWRL